MEIKSAAPMRAMALLIACLSLFSLGCGPDNVNLAQTLVAAGESSNQEILENIGQKLIPAAYLDVLNASVSLEQAATTFQASPGTANLQVLRDRWLATAKKIKEVEGVYFGPSGSLFLDANLDPGMRGYSVCNRTSDCATSVDSIIAGASTISTTSVGNQGVGVRGITAIEYLIFDDGSGNSSLSNVSAALTGRRLQYLVAACGDLVNTAGQLYNNWDPAGQNFGRQIARAGAGSNVYSRQLDAISAIISALLTISENLQDTKIGFPAGLSAKSGGTTHPDSVEYPYSNASLEAIEASVLALRLIYTGSEDPEERAAGLDDLVAAQNPDLNEDIKNQIEKVLERVSEIRNASGTLRAAIAGNPASVTSLHNEVRNLRILLATDLVSSTGASPGVGTNDGD
ncbi:MAG: imelysin family protein [Leptospiraceae bacterium]|nr:imelysin family protein [Leptospiraceae bacterium]